MLLQGKGLDILAADLVLLQKIDPQALVLEAESKKQDGIFPLLSLACDPEGIKLLRMCSDLVDKITPEALNKVCQRGRYKGVSPVLGLASKREGLDFLEGFPRLRRMISSSALETVSESKEFAQGISPLLFFAGSLKGRELLGMDDGLLVKMITSTGLNTICRVGANKGASPVYFLVINLDGRVLLRRFPRLCRMITLTTLCTARENSESKQNGVFPLWLSPN